MLPITILTLLLSAVSFQGALALPHIPNAGVDVHSRALRSDTAVAARQIAEAIKAIRLERRGTRKNPGLTVDVIPTVCNSRKYKKIYNISAIDCDRKNGAAFEVGNTCFVRPGTKITHDKVEKEKDIGSMGYTTMGNCLVWSFGPVGEWKMAPISRGYSH